MKIQIKSKYYTASSNGEWLKAIVPDFGPGWDLKAMSPADNFTLSPSSGGGWYEADGTDCAPQINEVMPYLCTYIDSLTGQLKVCNVQSETCPCSPPMMPGTPLPDGWYFVTEGECRGCLDDCRPTSGWGYPTNYITDFSVEFTLKVKEFSTNEECMAHNDLSIDFQTFSDGVAGCWTDANYCKLDSKQMGPKWKIDCFMQPEIVGNDTELCSEGNAQIQFFINDGGGIDIEVMPLPNPNIEGAMYHYFQDGVGVVDDFLRNTSDSIQVQRYTVQVVSYLFTCPTRIDTFEVVIYPEPKHLPDEISLCRSSDDNGLYPTYLDFEAIAPFPGGIWENLDGLNVDTSDWSQVDFSTADSTGLYRFSYTSTLSQTVCMYENDTLTIQLKDCICHDIVLQSPEPLCTDIGTFDLNNLIVNSPPGFWTSSDPDIVINDNSLIFTGVEEGSYQFIFTIDESNEGCHDTDTLAINISHPNSAGVSRRAFICVNEPKKIVDLFDYLNGENFGGTWTSESVNLGSDFDASTGTFDRSSLLPGSYKFRYSFNDPKIQ